MLPARLPPTAGLTAMPLPPPAVSSHDHDALDEVLTIIGLAASSGARPRDALHIAGEAGRGSLACEFAAVTDRLVRGSDLAAALRTAASQDDRVRRLHRIIEVADLDGTDYSAAIETIRSDLRRERVTELEIAAQKLSVAIQFPLVLCILPSFVVLALVPLVLAVLDDLGL